MSDDRSIPDGALRSALEFAVGIAAAGSKVRPALASPKALRPFLRVTALPSTALGTVRQAVEGDEKFRLTLAKVTTPDLLDDIGILWITRPSGWLEAIAERLAAPDADVDMVAALAAERRRREAAQAVAARARIDLVQARQEIDALKAATETAQAAAAAAVAKLGVVEAAIAEHRRDAQAAVAAATRAVAASDDARVAAAAAGVLTTQAQQARDKALAALAARAAIDVKPNAVNRSSAPPSDRAARRVPLSIPGGLYGDSVAAGEHLLRSDGVGVLVDGYNVAKLGWPALELAQQREACVALLEELARRWGVGITAVFDGADVADAPRLGRVVRVEFSPAGITADDVLRSRVAALPVSVSVVVVTDDRAIVADMRAAGANVIGSSQLLAVARG